MELDLEELAAIVELLEGADFTEFRLQKGDLSLIVTRGGVASSTSTSTVIPVNSVPAASQPVPTGRVAAPVAQPATPAAPAESTADLEPEEVLVTTPMLGTFYRSPKPGEAVFVEIGDKVDADSVVGIVEVMKLMTSVTAKVSGEITRVFAVDGDLVEAEQPLFAVRVFG